MPNDTMTTFPNPEVIARRQGDYFAGIPAFTDVAFEVDRFARRIPWWVWLGAGLYVAWRYAPRRGA